MAAQNQKIEYLFAAQVTGQGELQKLTMAVDGLRKEMDALKAASGGLGPATQQFTRSIGNASAHVQAYQRHLDAQSKAMRNSRIGTMQAGMQVNDFVTSVSTGASFTQAFNQQIGQVGYAMSMMGGKLGAVGSFLAGPWSIAIIGASMVLGPLIDGLFEVGDESKKTQKAAEDLDGAVEARMSSEDNLRLALAKTAKEYRQIRLEMQANALTAMNTAKVELAARLSVLQGLMSEQKAIESTIQKAGGLRAQSEMATGQSLKYASVTGGIQEQITAVQGQTTILERLTAKLNATTVDVVDANNRVNRELNKGAEKRQGKSDLEKQQEKDAKSLEDFFDIIEKANVRELPEYARQVLAVEEAFQKLNATQQATSKVKFAKIFEQLRLDDKGAQKEVSDYLKEPLKELPVSKEMEDIISRAGELNKSFEEIGNTVSEAFKGMLTGAMSWKDGMRSLIGSVIDQLWKLFVVQKIVGFISGALGGATGTPSSFSPTTSVMPPSGFIPANAYGGSVMGNKPTIVGERGPELFIPGGNGTIIPNSNMRGGGGGGNPISISVDARGSSDPAAVRAQVQQGILEAAPAIIAAAESRTISNLRRPRLGGAMQ